MTRFRSLTMVVAMILIAALINRVPAQENVMGGASGVAKSTGRAELERLKCSSWGLGLLRNSSEHGWSTLSFPVAVERAEAHGYAS